MPNTVRMHEEIDLKAGLADAPIAAALPGAVFGAVTRRWDLAFGGLLLGAVLGFVLHLVPRHFPRYRPRGPRIAMRAITGAAAGAMLGQSALDMIDPKAGSDARIDAAWQGAIAGGVTYAIWGAIEPHTGR